MESRVSAYRLSLPQFAASSLLAPTSTRVLAQVRLGHFGGAAGPGWQEGHHQVRRRSGSLEISATT
jgi:hypothetical protein